MADLNVMFKISIKIRFLAATLLFSGLMASCVAPHAWQTPRDMSTVLTEANRWPQVTTNWYARVEPTRMPEALSMLQDDAWRSLRKEEVTAFTPTLAQPSQDNLRPYLVRGVTYISPPAWTALPARLHLWHCAARGA